MSVADLRARHPWPAAPPTVPPKWQGWFGPGAQALLAARIGPETRLVVELGAWLGLSTRWLLERVPPAATVVTVDHWEGSAEHHEDPALAHLRPLLPVLYETFCANFAAHPRRDRLIPVRTTTLGGLRAVAAAGLAADLVYVDAGHETADVLADLREIAALFPAAKVVGDDWLWDSVRHGVELFARGAGVRIVVEREAWALEPRP